MPKEIEPGVVHDPNAFGLTKEMLKELAEMGVTIIVMDHPDKAIEVHNVLAEAIGEEYKLDQQTHKQNKEWTK